MKISHWSRFTILRRYEMLHAIGADYAVIVGAQEVAAGMVTLRDMRTGEQEMIGLGDAVLRIMDGGEGADHPISRGGSAVLDLP